MTQVRITVDDAAVRLAFREAAASVDHDLGEIAMRQAERIVVPAVRDRTPSIVRGDVVARRRGVGFTVQSSARGKQRSIFYLLNNGGVVGKWIRPKRGRSGRGGRPAALRINGDYVAVVKTRRKYRGKHFVEDGIQASLGRFTRAVEDDLARSVQRRLR